MEVIFIGKEFYEKSSTMMSSVYKVVGDMDFERTDWGFIQIALEKGENVNIRQATNEEREYFHRMFVDKWEKILLTNFSLDFLD